MRPPRHRTSPSPGGRAPFPVSYPEQDLDECLTYLRFPKEHQKRIRTTNLLERTFGESRRRTKVIPRFPTERSCLALVFASLITASAQWRDLCMTPRILRQLDALRPQQSLPTVSQAMANLGALRREGFYTEHWT